MLQHMGRILIALLFCTAAYSGEPQKPLVGEATARLIVEAQSIARTNNPEESATAYAKVLAAPDLTPDQRVNAHSDLARVYVAKNIFDAAAQEFDKALQAADLTTAHRLKALNAKAKMWFDSNFQGAWSSYYSHGIERAADVYREILQSNEFPSLDKIAVAQSLANCHLERMDTLSANKVLQDALLLPNLNDADVILAKRNVADALYRQLEFDKALVGYRDLWNEKLHVHIRSHIENRIVGILLRQKKTSEAEKTLIDWGRSPLELANFQFDAGNMDVVQQLYTQLIADKKNTFKDRCEGVEKLLLILARTKTLSQFIQTAESSISILIAEDERAWNVYTKFTGKPFLDSAIGNDEAFANWVSEKIMSAPKIPAGEFIKQGEQFFNSHVRHNKHDLARNTAFSILERADKHPKEALKYSIYLALLESKGNEARIVDRIKSVLATKDIKKDDSKGISEGLLLAARCAMRLRYYTIAKKLNAARELLLIQDEHRSTLCTFIPNGPKDISEFVNSDYFKDAKNRATLDRKYGDNLQFLLDTDAAMTGRKVTGKEVDFVPTQFVTTCDEDGIRFFFYATTSKAKDFAEGLTGMGGYEIYLSTGADDPYHCYLIDMPPNGMSDDFVTQYPNANFRRARQKEHTARIEHRVFENAVATLLSLPWESFFSKIPQNGGAWDFESLHWEQGGYSWGGSKSVHNRSSFGRLVFANMTEENSSRIKRRLISKAVNTYKKELSSQNGYIEIWQDPELGDQTFFDAAIRPLQNKLNKYMEKVKPGMSDDEVESLFDEAVPTWMNVKYVVAELRRSYLEEQRILGK